MGLGILAVLAGTASAQRTLTLDEALKLARQNSRDLKTAQQNIELAQATVEQVRAQLMPTLAAQGRYTYNYPSAVLDPKTFTAATDALAEILQATSSDAVQRAALQAYRDQLAAQAGTPITIIKEHQLDFAANATVPLIVPGAYPAYQSAVASKRATEANVAVNETNILFNAASLFYAAAGAEELVSARKHAIDVANETVKNAKARLEAGVVNRVEVTRAELALIRTVQELEEANDTRSRAYRSLATLLVLNEPFVVQPQDRVAVAESVDELQRNAMRLRPEARAYDFNLTAAKKAHLSGWLRWLPSLSAFGRFAAGNYSSFSGKQYSVGAGLQADWLLYDGGLRDAARHQAAAQQRQAELQLAQFRDATNADIAQAAQEVNTRRDALRAAEKSVALSQETLNLVRAQHAAGTATQLDLLQAQDALFSSEAAVARARFDLSLGELQLERNAGTFPKRRDGGNGQ